MDLNELNAYFNLLKNDGFYVTGGVAAQKWWKISYKTPEENRMYIYFSLDGDNILWYFPLIIQPYNDICRQALSRYLLLLNHELRLAQFTLDEDDQVCLVVELLGTSFSFSTLKTIFNIMRVYYEQYELSLRLISSNPTLAEAWLSLRPPREIPDVKVL